MDTPFKDENNIFSTRKPFSEEFTPEKIFERDDVFDKYTRALQSIVDGFGPSNIFVFGDSGLGKTAVTKKMVEFLEYETDKKDIKLETLKINCNKYDSNYSVVREIANQLSEEETYKQGHHKTKLWNVIYNKMDRKGGNFLLILDEIDQLGEEDELLYEFPRARSMGEISNAKVGVIGISNNQLYKENLRQRVKSTLCDSEIRFEPYTNYELQTILDYYASIAFKDGVLKEDVVPCCAAITAQESGDARFGLDLLEVAGEIARENEARELRDTHVKQARKEIERDRIKQIYSSGLTKQQQTVLLATVFTVIEQGNSVRLREIYTRYKEICNKINIDCLTKRRVSDFTQKLTEKGLLSADEKNSGAKGGRWFTYSLLVSPKPIVEAADSMNDTHSKLINTKVESQVEVYETENGNKDGVERQAQLQNQWN